MTREKMIEFIAMVQGRSVEDIELYFTGKTKEYIQPLYEKIKELRDVNDDDFLAA